MLPVLSWWLIVEILGLLALPICLRFFKHLPERGYALARPVGLLLGGYLLWIGASFGFLSNTRAAIVFVVLLVGSASLLVWRRSGLDVVGFLREQRAVVLATEILFAAAFFGWAFVRAHNPEISATEKPMEIAFLNAILRGERFPPHDPWLSGFAISYYYLGYLLMALITKLSGVAGSIAFNLAISLLFALTVTGSFGLTYNLIASEPGRKLQKASARIAWALLGPLFVAVIGNLEGLFEVLHTRGLGSPAFWRWLDVNGLIDAPVSGRWVPTDMWWWWRASRVVNDRDLQGVHQEVIDEFPQFSFLLGDMHPHVLALPFVLVVLGLALNLLLGAHEWTYADDRAEQPGGLRGAVLRAVHELASLWRDHLPELLLTALIVGSLGFLNTWDLPIHLAVVVAAFALGQRTERVGGWLLAAVVFALSVVVPGVILYLPFYVGFQSQAGGVLPTFFNVTRIHQYLLMFGLFVFVILTSVLQQIQSAYRQMDAGERKGMLYDIVNWILWLIVGPLLVMALAVASVALRPTGREFIRGLLADERVQAVIGSGGTLGLLRQALRMRLANPWTFLLLAFLIALLAYLLLRPRSANETEGSAPGPAVQFANLMAIVAFLLTLAVEFVYLRDLFGTRMNTVFKFYYQAWVLMAVAAAFGTYRLVSLLAPPDGTGRRIAHYAWLAGLSVLILAGMIYPLLAIPNKAGDFTGSATLDGMAYLQQVRPEDYRAMKWLQQEVSGIRHIVESTGGSYSDSAFVSAFTGLPTILGWDFHQYQWRGNTVESGRRQPEIAQIYQSNDSALVLSLLDKYDVHYVFVGSVERRKYELTASADARYERFLTKVYDEGGVTIYQR